jgi:hypothetical protein
MSPEKEGVVLVFLQTSFLDLSTAMRTPELGRWGLEMMRTMEQGGGRDSPARSERWHCPVKQFLSGM